MLMRTGFARWEPEVLTMGAYVHVVGVYCWSPRPGNILLIGVCGSVTDVLMSVLARDRYEGSISVGAREGLWKRECPRRLRAASGLPLQTWTCGACWIV